MKLWIVSLGLLLGLGAQASTDVPTLLNEALVQQDSPVEILAVRTLANLSILSARRYSVGVRNCGNDITHVKLRVSNRGVIVSAVGATFTDGTGTSYSYSNTFAAGYESSWIDLDNFRQPGKCVRTVWVYAQSEDPRVAAKVQVFGNMR